MNYYLSLWFWKLNIKSLYLYIFLHGHCIVFHDNLIAFTNQFKMHFKRDKLLKKKKQIKLANELTYNFQNKRTKL